MQEPVHGTPKKESLQEGVQADAELVQECMQRSHPVPAATGVHRQRHRRLWLVLVQNEHGIDDVLQQCRRHGQVQEDLRSLQLALLCTSATTTHMTSRAGGAAEDEAAVIHLLTPALEPDPRSSGAGLYI